MPEDHITKIPEAIRRAKEVLEQIQQTGTTFFLADLDLAMTFTQIASEAPEDSEKRVRNQANARHAYDEISRISSAAVLTDNERKEVDHKLAELRSALQRLGERFA
jgi:hypothetical protein